ARPPGGRRPSRPCTTVFGTFQFASLGFMFGWMPTKIVGLFVLKTIGGCDRNVALTCTPAFGMMYEARPRTVVSTGSTRRQFRGSGLSTFKIVAHVSLIPRPVVVPNCRFVLPFSRAFSVMSTPCQ